VLSVVRWLRSRFAIAHLQTDASWNQVSDNDAAEMVVRRSSSCTSSGPSAVDLIFVSKKPSSREGRHVGFEMANCFTRRAVPAKA
jgi:hypothetical protein